MSKILDLVVQERNYFEKHPRQLALLMKEYDDIHYASRYHENEEIHDWDNLKYAVIDLEEIVGEEYASLVYDAWCANIEDEEDSGHELEYKPQKTMNDIYAMCLDPRYRYNSIFPNKKAVQNHYLCVIGSGLAWTKDGFIDKRPGPSGTDMSLFWNFKKETLPSDIVSKCSWLKDKEIIKYRTIYENKKAAARKKNDISDALLEAEEFLKKLNPAKFLADQVKRQKERDEAPFYPLAEDYSLICLMPDNAHESYKVAAREICEQILNNKKESASNKKIAKKVLKKLG